MHDAIEVFTVLIGVGTAGAIVYGMVMLVNTLHARLTAGLTQAPQGLEDRLARLEAGEVHAAELDELHARLAEAEERLDFAERLLGQQGGGGELPPRYTGEVTPTN